VCSVPKLSAISRSGSYIERDQAVIVPCQDQRIRRLIGPELKGNAFTSLIHLWFDRQTKAQQVVHETVLGLLDSAPAT
jgi:hypothetical protein